jgi:hypothetical protein
MAKEQPFHYGGQAIIEGVMIRGRKFLVTAVRKPDKTLQVDKKPLPKLYTGRMRATPSIRGIIVLIESLVLGIQTLMHSANVTLEEEGGGENEKVGGGWVWLMMIVSLGFAVALFFLAPLFLTRLLNINSAIWFNVVEGLVRLAIFILYLRVVSWMPDIKRVFAYHGAEHKAVNGFEAGAALEPGAIKGYSKAHVRCGGSFLFVVLILAIIVFTIVGKPALWIMILSRILLVPVIAALGYEVIYFGARHTNNILVKIILAPGMWLQSLTTREPDESQLEVAIAALKTAVEADNELPAIPVANPEAV